MIRAVVVSAADLSRELRGTVLYRSNVERCPAKGLSEVRQLALAGRLDVVVVDSALPGAAALVAALRQDPATRPVAIVALGRSEFGFGHLDLLEAGANAILPLPPGADWDDRLIRLVHVPVRKSTRLPVDLAIEGGMRGGLRFPGRALNLSVNGVLHRMPAAAGGGRRPAPRVRAARGTAPSSATGTVVRLRPTRSTGSRSPRRGRRPRPRQALRRVGVPD